MPKKRKTQTSKRAVPPAPQTPISAWSEYKKNFVLTQFFILTFLIGAYYIGHVKAFWLLLAFLSSEIGSVMGAWMGAAMKRKMGSSKDRLPLE